MTRTRSRPKLSILGIALLVGLGGILYGYDIGVVSGALLFIKNSIPMTDTQVGFMVGAVLGGGLVGTIIAGPLADKFGRRILIALSSIVFILGVGCILIAHAYETLLLARILLGIGVGIIAVAVPLYVTELVPASDRGKYVTFFQLFLTFGIVLAYFVDLYFTPSGNWRAMFGVVLLPAIVLLLGVFRLPESPRWLVANGQSEKAMRILSSTRSKSKAESDLINIHNSLSETGATWKGLFTQKLALPLFIAVSIAILNQLTGINTFLQYAPDILKSAGLGSNFAAMLGSAGIGAINFICTIIALLLVDKLGRKPLLITGVLGIVCAEVFLGIVNYLPMLEATRGMLSLIGLFCFIIFFAIGPGVVVWLAISELLPTQVRGKAVALCLFFNSLAATVLASVFLDLRNALGMDGTYWLCAAFSAAYLCIAIFLLPETKSKTLEEITEYFQKSDDEKSSYEEAAPSVSR